jgi:hypothetical protein
VRERESERERERERERDACMHTGTSTWIHEFMCARLGTRNHLFDCIHNYINIILYNNIIRVYTSLYNNNIE